jgi:hypothetical protein
MVLTGWDSQVRLGGHRVRTGGFVAKATVPTRCPSAAARPPGLDTGLDRLRLDARPVLLPVESAVPCGLILNELVSNAYKHAFRERASGEIVVQLAADQGTAFELRFTPPPTTAAPVATHA